MDTAQLLVAGGTGTNGRALLKQLAAAKIPTRVLVRDPESASELANKYVELVKGDLSDKATLAAAFEGMEKAYIVTAIHRDAARWFDNFFDAAKQAGVRHLVKFSGYGSSEDAPSEVIRQHGVSDHRLRESGLTYTILRPNSFYQNMFWQADAIKETGQFHLPMADTRQSLVDVRDIAQATVRILTEDGHENRAYNLTGPAAPTPDELAATLSSVLDRDVAYVPVSAEAAKVSMLEGGMPEWNAHVLAEVQSLFASGDYATVEPALADLLGRQPRRFEDFVRDYATTFGGRA